MVRLDDRGRADGRPRRQLDTGRAPVLLDDPGHIGVEDELHPALQAPLVHRVRQRPHPAPYVPGAEGLLHVRQQSGARRGVPRIESVRQDVALEEGGQPGIGQLPRPHLGDGARRPGRAQQPPLPDGRIRIAPQHLPVGAQRLLQQRAPRPVPGVPGPAEEFPTVRPRPRRARRPGPRRPRRATRSAATPRRRPGRDACSPGRPGSSGRTPQAASCRS